jgi:ribonucleoside-triphosphate reductase
VQRTESASTVLPKIVRKRDGVTTQEFDVSKIENAVRKAWVEAEGSVDDTGEAAIRRVALRAMSMFDTGEASVEDIQDAVETALMKHKRFAVAKAYILYRQKRAEARRARRAPDPSAMSNYIHASKYARYVPELQRREVFDETVARVEMMHQTRFAHVPGFGVLIGKAFDAVREMRVLPSMRSLDNNTPIPTPEGWMFVGAVREGDALIDCDGHPTTVRKIQQFFDIELFDVHFSDGSVLRASGDHLWITSTLDDRIAGNQTRIVSTNEIRQTLRQKSGNERYPWKNNHAVWNPQPLQLPAKDLLLDPYILGLWLGDGFSHGGQFACHKDDAEIPAAYAAAGFPITPPADGNPYAWGTHGLATILRAMGLRDNKHIPREYLRASYEQRLALLQGLMDSDGHTTPEGRSCFANCSHAILDGVSELLSSLGIKYTTDGPVRKQLHHQDKYEFRFFTSLPVHRLRRKLASVRDDHRKSNTYRTIVSVEPAGRGDATCFEVDSTSHTYLAGPQMIVTHNSMQFGGRAVEVNHCRQFNCSATLIDRPRAFAEAMFLLLSGCGVGYSVQFEHVEKLPVLADVDPQKNVHHIIEDTIEGWADALNALVNAFIGGYHVEFAYHLIRPAGSPLRTSGGRAPGHQKLKLALDRIREVLQGAQGRQLRPIECHRILCHVADAVLSGGIRRSAMICLFSLDDSELMNIKTVRDWHKKEPWLQNANNSVVLKRDEVKEKQFKRIFSMTRNYGEPGVLFVSDCNHVTNPCAEIGLDPVLVHTDGSTSTGYAMCNLTEINASKLKTREDFIETAWAATLIGTMQATYTDMAYLGKVSEAIVRRDALLGIGMTGMQDSPTIACDPGLQREVAEMIVEWNVEWARLLGINSAARTTCIKPSGTTSLELGNVGSGIHPHHARRYIRRVTADELETVFQHFKSENPTLCVRRPDGKWMVEFPVQAPEGAVLKENLSAEQFMDIVRSTQLNWVLPGMTRKSAVPGLTHNVSNTITVRPHEWALVADYLWRHRDNFTGVSLLPDNGDTVYSFAPFEAVRTEAQERRWNELVAHYKPVDYRAIVEAEDGTDLTGEIACQGGACSIA